VRNALIVLIVVALVIVALGAVNHGLLFDIDLVAGTWTAVSLFWVAVVTAGVVFVTGMAAALLAQSGAVRARRKLEKELQGTYERLRAAEAKLPRPVTAQVAVVEITPGELTAVTAVALAPSADETVAAEEALEDETAVVSSKPEDETAVISPAADAETAVIDATPEDATVVVGPAAEVETADTAEASAADAADAPPPAAS
jgi:uncharacterized membrane protein YuzA (DUF378 family)